MPSEDKNVLGGALAPCSMTPRTGFYRDGCCNTGPEDLGMHIVCVQMTAKFLAFARSQGNDLITPAPEYDFPGLKPGDRWCVMRCNLAASLRSRRRGAGRAGGDARGNAGGRPAGSVEGARARHALNEDFQSYASEDRTTATAIQLVLRTQNHQVFFRPRGPFAGHSQGNSSLRFGDESGASGCSAGVLLGCHAEPGSEVTRIGEVSERTGRGSNAFRTQGTRETLNKSHFSDR